MDGGKIKEIQVKLLLSSRSEMHKVIEAARQPVPILSMTAAVPTPAPAVVPPAPIIQPATTITTIQPNIPNIQTAPGLTPFATALGNSLSNFGIPGIGNPQEIPQPAVIEPPAPMISPPIITPEEPDRDEDKSERKKSKEKDRRRSRSRSRSRDRDRKDRKRDRRDRSRSRERRRRDRSRSRDRRDRKRDRKDRSRSRDRSPSRRSRDRRGEHKSPQHEKSFDTPRVESPAAPPPPVFSVVNQNVPPMQMMKPNLMMQHGPAAVLDSNRFNDPSMTDAFNKLQELGKKRNPNAFQGNEQQNGGRFNGGRGGASNVGRGGINNFRRDGRNSRFDNNDTPRECCVAIRNAPNHTSYGDVRRFFPFMIDKHGIKMINDNMGRRTGNIFVRFCDPRSKQLALQRKNNELKEAEVVVENLDDETYEAAVDSFLPYREDNDEEESLTIPEHQENSTPLFNVLKLTDLPNFVKEHDIIKTFSDFSLLSIMLNDCRMTRSKIAFVQFVKPEDARTALERKERYMFGRRQPTITPVSDGEYDKEKAMQNDKITASDPHIIQNDHIENEPKTKMPPVERETREPAVHRDPRQRRPQFENTGPPGGIPSQQQTPGMFGTPFIPPQQQQFISPVQDPRFGGFPTNNMDPRTAVANWAGRPAYPNPNQQQMPQMAPNIPPQRNQHANDFENELLDCVLMKGLPREATDRTIVKFLSDTGAVPARIHLMLDANGMPSGDCFCEFRTTQVARMAASKHGHNLDGCRITVDLVSRSVVEEALEGPKQPEIREGLLGPPPYFDAPRGGFTPRGGGFRGRGFDRGGYDRGGFFRGGYDGMRGGGYRGRGGFDRGADRGGRGFDRGRGRGFIRGRGGFENGRDPREMSNDDQDPALEDFGAPGCVVSMENVPFRATVEEIMNFFSEFELTQDDVIRRYNERGQPTGDARVAFRTPFDAQRAVKTRHMDAIHERRISLTIL